MKISYYSDLHLEFDEHNWNHTFDDGADVLVLAGDIGTKNRQVEWILSQPHKHIIFVPGNHEYYKSTIEGTNRKLRNAFFNTKVHFLPEGESVVIDDVLFVGATLWTDFLLYGEGTRWHSMYEASQYMNDYKKIRREPNYRKLKPDDTGAMHVAQKTKIGEALKDRNGMKTVVVTHHAPCELSVPERYKNDMLSCAYASNLENLMLDYEPDYWIHGHIHDTLDYHVGHTNVLCNPRGYESAGAGNDTFSHSKVIEL